MVTIRCKGQSVPHTDQEKDKYGMMVVPCRVHGRLGIMHKLVPDISEYRVDDVVFGPNVIYIGCKEWTDEFGQYLAERDSERFKIYGNVIYWSIIPGQESAKEITIRLSDREITCKNECLGDFCEFRQCLDMGYALEKNLKE